MNFPFPFNTNREVAFARRSVQPPSKLYINQTTSLQLRMAARNIGLKVNVRVRILTPDGDVQLLQFEHVCENASYVLETDNYGLREGFLLSVGVAPTGAIVYPGEIWTALDLVNVEGNAAFTIEPLLADYVSTEQHIVWPPGRIVPCHFGDVREETVEIEDPAPGIPISVVPGFYESWEIFGGSGLFTTSAVAGNRNPFLSLLNPTSRIHLVPFPTAVPAGNLYRLSFLAYGVQSTTVSIFQSTGIGYPWRIRGTNEDAWSFQVSAVGLDAGDIFSQWRLLIRRRAELG